MSNSLWFSRIFTLQSFRWFCFNYSFWLFLRCIWKRLLREWKFFFFITIEFWNFSKFPFSFFSFPFLIFILFKITSNSFIYSSVEQFLETYIHKNNYRVRGTLFLKNLVNFFGFIYPLTEGNRDYIIRATGNTISNLINFK